jgi:hypothetical protein
MHTLAAEISQNKPIRLFQLQFSLLHAAIMMLLYYLVNVLRTPTPEKLAASAASATSAPSGFDFDFVFLSVSASLR